MADFHAPRQTIKTENWSTQPILAFRQESVNHYGDKQGRLRKIITGRNETPNATSQEMALSASIHDSKARNLMHAMNEPERLTQKLHIPQSVQETAAVFYRKALIAEVSIKDKKELSRCYRLLLRRLHIRMPADSALDYVSKIAEKAGASAQTEGLAARLIRQAREKHLTSGKDPSGLAGAAIYVASQLTGERLTQTELSRAANVTEVTIRNRKKDLIKGLNINSASVVFYQVQKDYNSGIPNLRARSYLL